MTPHQSNLRTGRSSEIGRIYVITKCVEGRKPLLTAPVDGQWPSDRVIDSLRTLMRLNAWTCLGYVVMPDHVHFVIRLMTGTLFSHMNRFSTFTGREINSLRGESGTFWQEGYFDHALRGERSLTAYLTYMMANPVRANLVAHATDWKWSAAYPKWEGSAPEGPPTSTGQCCRSGPQAAIQTSDHKEK